MDIQITFDNSLFGSADGLNVVASGHAYAAAIREALAGQYPGSNVSITFDPTTSGARSKYSATDEYGEGNDEALQDVYQICRAVFNENPYWQIEEAAA